MPNTYTTADIVAELAIEDITNKLTMGKLVHKQFKKEFKFKGAIKGGNKITINKPLRFAAKEGATRIPQNISEQTTSLCIDRHFHVSWDWSVIDKTMSIREVKEIYIGPAMTALREQMEMDLFGLYIDVAQATGTAGTTPASWTAIADGAQKLVEAGVPQENISCILNPAAFFSMGNVLGGKYSSDMVEKSLRHVSLGTIATANTYMSPFVKTHTIGTCWAGATINGASQTGSSLTLDGFTADGTLKKGDVFTIDDVYHVQPRLGQSTGALQQFVLTADATVSGGAATVSISPSIITEGAYQTVDAAPADNASINVPSANERANLMFHKNAFALVTVPIDIPESAPFKATRNKDGLSISVSKQYDIDGFQEAIRFDALWGVKTLYPDWATRIRG